MIRVRARVKARAEGRANRKCQHFFLARPFRHLQGNPFVSLLTYLVAAPLRPLQARIAPEASTFAPSPSAGNRILCKTILD